MACFSSQIQAAEHKYLELDWGNEEIPRGDVDKNVTSFFHPLQRLAPTFMQGVVGTNTKPAWYSPAPLYQHNQDADLALYEHYSQHGGWLGAGDTWLALLLRGPRLLVSNSEILGKNAIYFVLPEFCGIACMGWPAEKVKVGGVTFLRPFGKAVTAGHIKWLIVDDVKHWKTQSFDWKSPAHCAVLAKSSNSGGIWAKPNSEARPMLQTAAWEAFWESPFSQITAVCKHLGVVVAGDDTLFTRLQKLVKHCLPDLDMEQLHSILAKRIKRPVPLQE